MFVLFTCILSIFNALFKANLTSVTDVGHLLDSHFFALQIFIFGSFLFEMNIFKILFCRKTVPFVGILIVVAACSVIITCIAILSIGVDKLKWASCSHFDGSVKDSSVHRK